MERREDSTLTSPYVTPFGRSSMTAVCRGDKTEDEKQSGFSWFLFTPFSNTTVFYTYILLLLLFRLFIFAIVLFLPLHLFIHYCFFKFLQLPHGRRLRRWCCPFLPFHTQGTSLREWHGSGAARRKPSEYLPESIRADSPAWLTSPVATPKRRALNDGCRLWGLGGTKGKASRHPTFCISRIVLGTTGQIQRFVCWWAIPTRVHRMCQTDDKHLSVPSDAHLFMGLPSLLFSVHCQSFYLARRFIQ